MHQGTLKNISRLFNRWCSHRARETPKFPPLETIHTQTLGWMFCGRERRSPPPLCWNLGTLPKTNQGAVQQRRNMQVSTIWYITAWGWVGGNQHVKGRARGWSLLLGLRLNFLQCLTRAKLPGSCTDDHYVDCPRSLKRPHGRGRQRNQFFWIAAAVCWPQDANFSLPEKVNVLLSCIHPT